MNEKRKEQISGNGSKTESPRADIISELTGLCNKILLIDGVRHCSVRDEMQQEIGGGQKNGINRIEKDEERVDSEHRVALMVGLFDAFPKSFGNPRSLSVIFDNLLLFVFPFEDRLALHITLEPNSTPEAVHNIEEMVRVAQLKMGKIRR